MNNVVVLDVTAAARQQAAAVRRKYVLERASDEVWALRRNRAARIARTRRFWVFMCALSFLAGALLVKHTRHTPGSVPSGPALATTTQIHELTATASLTKPTADLVVSTNDLTEASVVEPAIQSASTPATSTRVLSPIRPQAISAGSTRKKPSEPTKDSQNSDERSSTRFEVSESRLSAAIATSVPQSTGWKLIGVPIDGVVQIQIGSDQTVRHLKIGQQLPNGAEIRAASSEFQTVETTAGRVLIKP